MSFTKLDAKNKMSRLVFISKESFLVCESVSKLGVFVVVHWVWEDAELQDQGPFFVLAGNSIAEETSAESRIAGEIPVHNELVKVVLAV